MRPIAFIGYRLKVVSISCATSLFDTALNGVIRHIVLLSLLDNVIKLAVG